MNGAPLERVVTINNPNGLHMRPCAAFVEAANAFESAVTIVTRDGRALNGKSILDLMGVGLAGLAGSELLLRVEGPDAPEALEVLAVQLASVPNYDASAG
jgi:phosphotransferase system HPr (HPr) family protein